MVVNCVNTTWYSSTRNYRCVDSKELACRYPSSILWELCGSSWKNVRPGALPNHICNSSNSMLNFVSPNQSLSLWHWCRTCTSKPQVASKKHGRNNMPEECFVRRTCASNSVRFPSLILWLFSLGCLLGNYAKGKLCCAWIHAIGLAWKKLHSIPHLFTLVWLNAYSMCLWKTGVALQG